MKISSSKLCLLFLLLGLGYTSHATHIFGADFYYEHLTGNNYRVSLAIYGDCGGQNFPQLAGATAIVELLESNVLERTINLSLQGPGVEVTPVCASQINNTTCKGGTIPGVTRYIYSAVTTVPFAAADWRFHFTGNMLPNTSTGRSFSITNLTMSSSSPNVMVLDANLNNMNGNNSSPRFSTIPTPFFCVNVPQQYNQGAIDPDGDQLSYSLAPAQTPGGPSVYNSGFSPTNPMGLAAGLFSFNTSTGQMNFTSNFTQNACIVNKVSEYKNGILVGTATREMTFVIQAACNNATPTGVADTLVSTYTGGKLDAANNVFSFCQGTPFINFQINANDPDTNNITITGSGVPAGANFTISANGTPTPVIFFSWSAAAVPAGSYTFFINYKDDACPISNQQTQAFTIKVLPIPTFSTVDTAFYCKGDIPTLLHVTATPGSTIFWYDSLGNSLSTTPVPGTAVTGVFRWFASAQLAGCNSQKVPVSVYVTNRPVAGVTATPATVCMRDSVLIKFTGTVGTGPFLKYIWDWDGGSSTSLPTDGGGPWVVRWLSSGTKKVTVQVLENQCPSNVDTAIVEVKPLPEALFVRDICLYDTLNISYGGTQLPGQQYLWTFDDGSIRTASSLGPFNIKYETPGTKRILLSVTREGCTDTLTKYAVVHELPDAKILTIPTTICIGDKVYLEHSGMGDYTWTPNDRIFEDEHGKLYTRVVKPTTFTLNIRNIYGCVDSDAITYNNIEPCCNFAYPNAFTPNKDGMNDVFRVVTYGNDEFYSLSIYNRWGQRVFHTGNPKEGWDGTWNGRDADAGTYFYYLTAKCLTGYEENKKGDFTLIR